VYNFGGIRSRKLRGYAANNSTFCGDTANLVNFLPIISEFTPLKCAIFAVIFPQFDNDFHSSRWRNETDWKIAILTKWLNRMNYFTLCAILMTFGSETKEFTLLTIAPFAVIRQKSAYHTRNLRTS